MSWLNEFLKLYMKRNMSLESIAVYTDQMMGKTSKEKELLAEQFVKELQAEQ